MYHSEDEATQKMPARLPDSENLFICVSHGLIQVPCTAVWGAGGGGGEGGGGGVDMAESARQSRQQLNWGITTSPAEVDSCVLSHANSGCYMRTCVVHVNLGRCFAGKFVQSSQACIINKKLRQEEHLQIKSNFHLLCHRRVIYGGCEKYI